MHSRSAKDIGAIWIFLGRILSVSTVNTSILWRVDNTTALAYLRGEGGLRGRRLLWEAASMLLLFRSCRMRLLPAFFPSEGILQEGVASRFRPVPVWHLDSNVVSQMVSPWGTPQIDLFASRQSAQFRRFMSWRAADGPEAVDALSMVWVLSSGLPLPTHPLLLRVVGKLEVSKGVFLLVTPHWEAQMWFASLQALPVLEVRCLPFHESLVVGLVTGVPPPSLGRLFPVV
jgi:hypothetical protein